MFDTIAKLTLSRITDHWESILTIGLIVLYGRNDYRVTKLEKADKVRTVNDCECLMNRCSIVNEERFSNGRREFDGFVAALNRMSDHFEDDNKITNAKLDKIMDFLVDKNH